MDIAISKSDCFIVKSRWDQRERGCRLWGHNGNAHASIDKREDQECL